MKLKCVRYVVFMLIITIPCSNKIKCFFNFVTFLLIINFSYICCSVCFVFIHQLPIRSSNYTRHVSDCRISIKHVILFWWKEKKSVRIAVWKISTNRKYIWFENITTTDLYSCALFFQSLIFTALFQWTIDKKVLEAHWTYAMHTLLCLIHIYYNKNWIHSKDDHEIDCLHITQRLLAISNQIWLIRNLKKPVISLLFFIWINAESTSIPHNSVEVESAWQLTNVQHKWCNGIREVLLGTPPEYIRDLPVY